MGSSSNQQESLLDDVLLYPALIGLTINLLFKSSSILQFIVYIVFLWSIILIFYCYMHYQKESCQFKPKVYLPHINNNNNNDTSKHKFDLSSNKDNAYCFRTEYYSKPFFSSFLTILLFWGEFKNDLNTSCQLPSILILLMVWSATIGLHGRQMTLFFHNSRSYFIENTKISPLFLIASSSICLFLSTIFTTTDTLSLYTTTFSHRKAIINYFEFLEIYHQTKYTILFALTYMMLFFIILRILQYFAQGCLSFAELMSFSQTCALLLSLPFPLLLFELPDKIRNHPNTYIFVLLSKLGMCVLGFLLLTTLVTVMNNTLKNLTMYSIKFKMYIQWIPLSLLVIAFFVLCQPFQFMTILLWNGNHNTQWLTIRTWTLGCWITGALLCCLTAEACLLKKKKSLFYETLMRKTFHIACVLSFVPTLVYKDLTFLTCAILVGFLILLVIETCRITQIPSSFIASLVTQIFARYIDNRDRRGIILTHSYLLLGVGFPIIYETIMPLICSREADPIATYLGLFTVGLADAAAALFGFNGHQLPYCSKKTWEGLLAFLFTCLSAFLFLFYVLGLTFTKKLVWTIILSTTLIASIFEATTKEIDNFLLPLLTLTTYKCLSV